MNVHEVKIPGVKHPKKQTVQKRGQEEGTGRVDGWRQVSGVICGDDLL